MGLNFLDTAAAYGDGYFGRVGPPTPAATAQRSQVGRLMPPLKPIKKAGLVLFGILVAVTIGEGFLTWIDYSYTPLRIKTIENYTEWRFRLAFENKDFVYDSYLIWRPREGSSAF
jgi:hypothetical protein